MGGTRKLTGRRRLEGKEDEKDKGKDDKEKEEEEK